MNMLRLLAIAGGLIVAAEAEDIRVPHESTATSSNQADYGAVALQLQDAISQIPDPELIESTLDETLKTDVTRSSSLPGWSAVRHAKARAIFDSLSKLDTALRTAHVATNFAGELSPPRFRPTPGVPVITYNNGTVPEDSITDPREREQMREYSAASKAKFGLSNLLAALEAEYRRHWDAAINLVVQMYSKPPKSDTEIKSLLDQYRQCDCAQQFSNRFYRVSSQPP